MWSVCRCTNTTSFCRIVDFFLHSGYSPSLKRWLIGPFVHMHAWCRGVQLFANCILENKESIWNTAIKPKNVYISMNDGFVVSASVVICKYVWNGNTYWNEYARNPNRRHHFGKISLWTSCHISIHVCHFIAKPVHNFIYLFFSVTFDRTACGNIVTHSIMFWAPHILRFMYLNITHRTNGTRNFKRHIKTCVCVTDSKQHEMKHTTLLCALNAFMCQWFFNQMGLNRTN